MKLRNYPIEMSVDIEKAFFQLGIIPEYKDSRFFYPEENGQIVYRHSQVVLVVS